MYETKLRKRLKFHENHYVDDRKRHFPVRQKVTSKSKSSVLEGKFEIYQIYSIVKDSSVDLGVNSNNILRGMIFSILNI